jgi:hypothetical protein
MPQCFWLLLALAGSPASAAPTETVPCVSAPDTLRVLHAAVDTPQVIPVEYSEWYGRRVAVHRAASYTMVPLFAAQYAAGRRLYDNPALDANDWARRAHKPLAYAVGGLFTLNTVTGVWNLWEARKDPEGRGRRTTHALLMLAADAGFAATGMLGSRAAHQGGSRTVHRNVALGSMATAVVGYLVMLPQLRE